MALPAGSDRDLHVVLRLTYGLMPGLLDEVRAAGAQAWILGQLARRTQAELVAGFPSVAGDPGAVDLSDPAARTQAAFELQRATILRQVASPAQLYEVMVEFWTNHFSIFLFDGAQRVLKLTDDRTVARAHALGRFTDLLTASAQSPAMLVYLDNASSAKGAINENYSRELLELHTVGVDGGYSEADVVAVAQVLTGWTVRRPAQGGGYRFAADRHDDTPRSVMGWRTPDGVSGEAQGRSLLDYLARHERTAHNLARKLVIRFVSDEPDPGLVDTVAAAYLAADTDIAATLAALFGDERFFTTARAKFRRPNEFLVALLRASGGTVADGQLASRDARQLTRALEALGQPPMGWPAPNGYPDVAGAWLNAGGLLARWNAAADLLAGSLGGFDVDVGALAAAVDPAAGASAALAQLAPRFLGAPADPAATRALTEGLNGTDRSSLVPTAAALMACAPRFQYR